MIRWQTAGAVLPIALGACAIPTEAPVESLRSLGAAGAAFDGIGFGSGGAVDPPPPSPTGSASGASSVPVNSAATTTSSTSCAEGSGIGFGSGGFTPSLPSSGLGVGVQLCRKPESEQLL